MNETVKRIIKTVVQFAAIAGLIYVDWMIKTNIEKTMQEGELRNLIPGFLGLAYVKNTGSAFSLFSSATGALTVVTSVALAAGAVALIVVRKKPLIYDICVPLIIAGGGGNLLDRVTKGYVVDYLQTLFMDFPVFNFADCLVTCSCIALIIYLIVEMIRDGRKKKEPQVDPYIAEWEADE